MFGNKAQMQNMLKKAEKNGKNIENFRREQ